MGDRAREAPSSRSPRGPSRRSGAMRHARPRLQVNESELTKMSEDDRKVLAQAVNIERLTHIQVESARFNQFVFLGALGWFVFQVSSSFLPLHRDESCHCQQIYGDCDPALLLVRMEFGFKVQSEYSCFPRGFSQTTATAAAIVSE